MKKSTSSGNVLVGAGLVVAGTALLAMAFGSMGGSGASSNPRRPGAGGKVSMAPPRNPDTEPPRRASRRLGAEVVGTPVMYPPPLPVSSRYGWRIHPTLKVWKMHDGVDIPLPEGVPVTSPVTGTVISVWHAETSPVNGNGVAIRGVGAAEGFYFAMLHLDSIGVGPGGEELAVGDQVTKGQLIGTVGETGRATGDHLHYQVAEGTMRNTVDPESVHPEGTFQARVAAAGVEVGDLLPGDPTALGSTAKAVFATPEVKDLIQRSVATGETKLRNLSLRDGLLLGSTFVGAHAVAAIAVAQNPTLRGKIVDSLHQLGRVYLPVPGVPWLKANISFDKGNPGAGVKIDIRAHRRRTS